MRIKKSILRAVPLGVVLSVLVATGAGGQQSGKPPLSVQNPIGSVTKGSTPQFRVTATKAGKALLKSPYAVYVRVARTRDTDKFGVLLQADTVFLQKMTRKGNTFTARPAPRTYNGYWLKTPDTYWWQAYIIKCPLYKGDCWQEIKARPLKVVN